MAFYFFVVFLLGMMAFFKKKIYILNMLMIFEMILMLLFLVFLIFSVNKGFVELITFFVIAVCETCVGFLILIFYKNIFMKSYLSSKMILC